MTDSRFDSMILLINRGDKSGLKEIYGEYGKFIYSVMLSAVKNQHDAEDLTADFFLKLWNIADTYRSGNGHKRWLASVAANMAKDFLRKSGREELTIDMEDEDGGNVTEPTDNVTPENTVIGEMTVAQALQTLNPSEREVINLKLYGGMTFADISEALKKPLGTITWRYRSAMEKLKNTLKEVRTDG